MKHILPSLFLIVFLVGDSSAQSNFSTIVEMSGSISPPGSTTVGFNGERESDLGYGLGIFINYYLSKSFSIASGIEYKKKSILYHYQNNSEEFGSYESKHYETVHQLGIPLGLIYFRSTSRFFEKISASFDFFLSGRADGTFISEDLSPYYDKIEITLEPEIGYIIPLGKSDDFRISISYSIPLINPYDKYSIANGYTAIPVFRLKLGLASPL